MPVAGTDTEDVMPKNTGRFLPPWEFRHPGGERDKKTKKTITDYEKYKNNNTQCFDSNLSGL